MAKLLIFRGEAPHGELELTGKTLRIGRSSQNEIVLEDPSKGVSRTHAEIRFENGHYTLVDLESQNGIWVSGTRVPSVVLDPDVVASVGPFRLMIEAPVAVPAAAGSDPSTESTRLAELSAAEPLLLDNLAPSREDSAPSLSPETLPPTPEPRHPPRLWLAAAAAALVIGLSTVVVYRLMRDDDRATWDGQLARTLVESGACREALEKHIDPALADNPNNLEARALKDKCASPPPPPPSTTTSVPVPSVSERLDEVERLISANDCATALDRINAVLAENANDARATELFAKATACGTPLPNSSPPTSVLAVKVPPSQGGLEPLPKETDKNYKARIQATKSRYDEGVSQLQKNNYRQALKIFEEIASEVPSGYLELAQRRDEARAGLRVEGKNSLEAAQAAESRQDFDAAISAYRRARELDPSIQIDGAIQRINERKLELGRKSCEEGKVLFSYGTNNAAAAAAFQDALKLLPPSDPCYAIARERLKQLAK